MPSAPLSARRDLGEVDLASGRRNWTRSAAAATDDAIFAGTAANHVVALEAAADSASDPDDRWEACDDNPVVSMATADDFLVVGECGGDGLVRILDAETGDACWTHITADDVGTVAGDSLSFRLYIVDLAVTGDRVVAAAWWYERNSDERVWRSVVLGPGRGGRVVWRRRVHASPIAVAAEGNRVVVVHNRCLNPEQDDLMLLDAHTGGRVASWGPGIDDDRRVGDVALAGDAPAVASHGNKRGYLLDSEGDERWRIDLASERRVGDETVYVYLIHVCVAGETAAFVTGNTFAELIRNPDARHPDEHTVVGASVDGGECPWTCDTDEFARVAVAAGPRVFVPSVQYFREREADRHGVRMLGVTAGYIRTDDPPSTPIAVVAGEGALVVVEGPVEYHDEGATCGAYRLRTRPTR